MPNTIFQKNVIIITGGSSGIGEQLAYQLADQGAWLALAARNQSRLASVAEKCQQRGARVLSIPTDITDKKQCKNLIEGTLAEYGRIDTLINNAGISMRASVEQVEDLSIFDQIMQVNYLGSVYCTYFALPYLKKNQGRIGVLGSLTSKTGVPSRSGYAASKHALEGFFDSLRIELADSGVTVTIAYPDYVATDARQRALGANGHPIGSSPVDEEKIMTAETCAGLIIKALGDRQRADNQTLRAKLIPWAKLIAPGLMDKLAQKAVHTDQ